MRYTCAAASVVRCGQARFSDGPIDGRSTMMNGGSHESDNRRPPGGGRGSRRSGRTCPTPPGIPAWMGEWICSQRDFLAAILAQQDAVRGSGESRPDQPTEASSKQLMLFDLDGYSSKIAPSSEREGGPSSRKTSWREDIAGETESLPRLTSGHHTGECGGFCSRLAATLTVHGNYNHKGSSPKSGNGLATWVNRLLPTLIRSDTKGPDYAQFKRQGRKTPAQLPTAIAMLPTLCATDYKTPYSEEGYRRQAQERSKPLRDTAAHTVGIRLTPDFCEWWMGWPIGGSALPG